MINIGFVGVGNIASTIIKGLSTSKLDLKLWGFNHNHVNDHVKELTDQNMINMVDDINDLVKKSDYIIFCVKPNNVDSVLENINKELINDSKVFMSVAAGIKLEHYEQQLGSNAKFIRVMPNVNAAVKQSMTAICSNKNVSEQEQNFAIELFNQVGKTVVIKEDVFDIFMAMAGSFPAAVFMLIDSIANVGVEYGLPKQQANEIATQTILGSAIYAQQNGVDKNINIRSLMDTVMSPNGTTINGIQRLEDDNFSSIIEKAIIAMMKSKREDN